MNDSEINQYIHWFLNNQTFNEQDREDIVQDCWVKILSQMDNFDKNKSCLSTFLFVICYSVYIDYLRKIHTKHLHEVQTDSFSHFIKKTSKPRKRVISLFGDNND